VIHTHSTHCVALTLQDGGAELLPPITPYFVMKVGHVPVVPYHRPGAPRSAEAVAALIARYGPRHADPRRDAQPARPERLARVAGAGDGGAGGAGGDREVSGRW
jgi:hypothetical protein